MNSICVSSTPNAAGPSPYFGFRCYGLVKGGNACTATGPCISVSVSLLPIGLRCRENLRSPRGGGGCAFKTSRPSPKASSGQTAPLAQVCAPRRQPCKELLQGAQEDGWQKGQQAWTVFMLIIRAAGDQGTHVNNQGQQKKGVTSFLKAP